MFIQNTLPEDFFTCSEYNEEHEGVDIICACNPAIDSVFAVAKKDCLVLICPNCDSVLIKFPFIKNERNK